MHEVRGALATADRTPAANRTDADSNAVYGRPKTRLRA